MCNYAGEDCFTVGRYAYIQKQWRHSRQWMLTALERFDEEQQSSLDVPSVYDHLSFSEYSVSLNQSIFPTVCIVANEHVNVVFDTFR